MIKIIPILIFQIILPILISSAYAVTKDIQWNPNSESDLAGYRVYVGTESGVYTINTDVGNMVTHKVIVDPGETKFMAVTAYDTSGNESGKSNEIFWSEPPEIIPDTDPPLPPTGLSFAEKVGQILKKGIDLLVELADRGDPLGLKVN